MDEFNEQDVAADVGIILSEAADIWENYTYQWSDGEQKIFVQKRNDEGKVIATREIRITLV